MPNPESNHQTVTQRQKDILLLEDDIQRIHNKIEYDRTLTEDDIIQKKKLLTELTADLKEITSKK